MLLIFMLQQHRGIVIATAKIRRLSTGIRLLVKSGCGRVVTTGLHILNAGSRLKKKITLQLHVIYVVKDWKWRVTGC
jgi:hypothetical protein